MYFTDHFYFKTKNKTSTPKAQRAVHFRFNFVFIFRNTTFITMIPTTAVNPTDVQIQMVCCLESLSARYSFLTVFRQDQTLLWKGCPNFDETS